MSIQTFLEQAGVLLLIVVACVYFGMRLLILKDVSAIRGKNKPPVKDPEKYAASSGKLILFLGAATFIMAILQFVNVYAALAEIIVCILVMGFVWKHINDKYGE